GARDAYLAHLDWAAQQTTHTLLIEPICRAAMPGYFLHSLDQAASVIADLGRANIKVMFDCFHIETEHGECLARYKAHADIVGHVQIASVPERAEPDGGDLDYASLLPALIAEGYDGAFGCEYRARGPVEDGLGWLRAWS
ncbi:MAG: TIM barrel protein, partial [Pseudomonadota bacterium]